MNIYAVIMAGGVGSRFWPRSRAASPKQVLNIVGESTMIQETHRRLKGLVKDENVLIVTNQIQKEIIEKQLPELDDSNYVIEPFGKNTAPCIGLAALHIVARDPEGVMVVLAADHIIENVEVFHSVLKEGAKTALENGGLITLGITPNAPSTGYGYIHAGEKMGSDSESSVYRVQQFKEKPDLKTAQEFLDNGSYYWNSGMFIWKASTILDEIKKNMPATFDCLSEIGASLNTPEYPSVLEDAYGRISGTSIDYGVMQEADNVFVIPADMDWNDVGSWEIVHDISEKDAQQNTATAKALIDVGSTGNYVFSPDKTVALVGMENVLVVDTGDALLICKKDNAQDVKKVVDILKSKGLTNLL